MSDIINTYQQLVEARKAGFPCAAICPHHWEGTREWYRDGWEVYHPWTDFKIPNLKWGQSKSRLPFSEHGSSRAEALQAAKAYCAEHYGITEWKRNRMGDYIDARVFKAFPLASNRATPGKGGER